MVSVKHINDVVYIEKIKLNFQIRLADFYMKVYR